MELIGEFETIGFNRTGYPQVTIKIYLDSDDIIYYTESYYSTRGGGINDKFFVVTDFKTLIPRDYLSF